MYYHVLSWKSIAIKCFVDYNENRPSEYVPSDLDTSETRGSIAGAEFQLKE